VYTPTTVVRRIERSVRRAAVGGERRLVVRVHPEVVLRVFEEESDFLKRLMKQTKAEVVLRDDPLMRQDEFRLLAGPSETDVTAKYLVR